MPPCASQSLSCLRLYGSAMRTTGCGAPFAVAQRAGALPLAVATWLKSSHAFWRASHSAGSATGCECQKR